MDTLEPSKIESLEAAFPPASGAAFAQARKTALNSGLSVLQVENGVLYQCNPDGSRVRIKSVSPATPVTPGQQLHLK